MQTQPTYQAIMDRLQSLHPLHLELDNESANHAGFYEGKESHFKLTLVSDEFVNKRLIARHQMVYQALSGLLTRDGGSVHALAMHTYTNAEWQTQQTAPDSPQCASQVTQSSKR